MTLRRLLRGVRVRVAPPKAKPLILMYHRVAAEALDPWGNIVSPSNFEEHLDVLRRTRFPLSLTDFVSRHLRGMLPGDAVAVTFDDGYVDNLFAAKPRLLEADIPATVFLATGYLGQPGGFWWDELARLVLTATGPAALEVTVRGKAMRLDLANDSASRDDHWKAWLEPPRTARQAAYLQVWRIFRSLESWEREALMGEIKRAFTSLPAQREFGRPMTTEEVRGLVDDQLIAIGPHTVTHASLPDLDPRSRTREIIASKKACEALAGVEARAFAYPFGNLDAGVRDAVDEAGFICACSTKHGPVLHSSDVFALPRIHVVDCDGDRFERSLHYASMAVDEGPG